tara:strand:- start:124 stop:594 length:471 start_codon:yes stop_codon:yes gene_type:complete
MDIERKKQLVNIVKSLSDLQKNEIFNIIQKNKVKYSENNNGIFINITDLNCNIINDIYNYIEYSNSSNDEIFENKSKYINNNVNNNFNKDSIINFKEYINIDLDFLKGIDLNLVKNSKKENHLKFINKLKKYNRFIYYIVENNNNLSNLKNEQYIL